LESNPLATYFLHGQVIQMPAYRNVLKDDDVEAIMAYIGWLRQEERAFGEYWVEPDLPPMQTLVERGKWLYVQTGCVACHGPEGRGGVENTNVAGGYVSTLDDFAEKLELFEREEIHAVVDALDRGFDPEDHSELAGVPYYDAFLSQYREMIELIIKGGHAQKRDDEGPDPPILMPGWNQRLYADDGPISKADIRAIVAYLLTLQPLDDEG
jgi:hypothetical protein